MTSPAGQNRYRADPNAGLLIDTNLLLLLIVGSCDPSYLLMHKRTQSYRPSDLHAVLEAIKPYQRWINIPNILTETSNLLAQSGVLSKAVLFRKFKDFIQETEELYVESKRITSSGHFDRFGLTDLAILEAVREQHVVMTDDFRLADYLRRANVMVAIYRG